MAISNNKRDRDYANFQEHPSKPLNTERFVADETAHDKLDTIASGLGVTNTTPSITRSAVVATTETTFALPANTKQFKLKVAGNASMRIAYTNGGTASQYYTIPRGTEYTDNNFYSSQNIYIYLSTGDTVELIAFS